LKQDPFTTAKHGEIPLSGDAFRGICDHVFWCNSAPRENAAFRQGDIVFCKIDEVWRLFRALRRTRRRIVLVTGEGSRPVTPALWRRKPPHVAAWLGTNMFFAHRNAHAIPLGLGNAGSATTPTWDEIRKASAAGVERNKWLYANFGDSTNPAVRVPLSQWLGDPARGWVTRADHGGPAGKESYLAELVRHRFVLCPPGTGEDTHRFWEALYAGCIPVIRDSAAMRSFSLMLPVLVVHDLRETSEPMLRAFAADHAATSPDCGPLGLPYWHSRILAQKTTAVQAGQLSWRALFMAWAKETAAVAGEKSQRQLPSVC